MVPSIGVVRVFPLSGRVRISCCMEVENISNELWVALWDVVSVDELAFATLEPVLKWVGQGWLQQPLYPWWSARSLFFAVLRLVSGH